jgi:putative Mg2+ transporter-C (MgtC) family protein
MDIEINYEFALRILISFIIGSVIGFEREYRSKAAGLRTILMICMGSTIFTIISPLIDSDSKDRIASTIVTGVGFLGAGVIFKDGLSVTGLTTASTIWIAAALGMAIGMGEYFVAFVSSAVVLIILTLLEKIQQWIEQAHQVRSYKINTQRMDNFIGTLEGELKNRKIHFRKKRDMKEHDSYLLIYDISGNEKKLDRFNDYLKNNQDVEWFQY